MASKYVNVRHLKIKPVISVVAEDTDVVVVNVQLTDRENGNEIGERVALQWYLSDDAAGDSVVATAPSGGIDIGTDGLMMHGVTDKYGIVISEVDGDIDFDITEAGTDTFYLILVAPDGKLYPSAACTFAA